MCQECIALEEKNKPNCVECWRKVRRSDGREISERFVCFDCIDNIVFDKLFEAGKIGD